MEKLLLKPTEAADALGVSRSTIYELVAAGTVPSVRLGRSVRVPVASLWKFAEVEIFAVAEKDISSKEPISQADAA